MPEDTPLAAGGEQPPQAEIETPTVAPATEQQAPKPEITPTAKDGIDAALESSGLDIASLTDEQLSAIESGDASAIAAALGIEHKPQQEIEAKPDPDKAGGEQTPKNEGEQKGLDRVSLKAVKNRDERILTAQALELVRLGKHANLKDALREVFGFDATQAPVADEAANAKPKPDVSPPASDEITAIEAQLQAAEADMERLQNVEFNYVEAQKKLLEVAELRAELKLLRRDAAKQAKAEEARAVAFEAEEKESRARAYETYGELLGDPETGFADAIEAEYLLADSRGDVIFTKPDWPEQIAKRVYDKYFAGRGGGAQPGPSSKTTATIPAAPAKPGVRLPGSPIGAGGTAAALTPEQALAKMADLSPEEQDALLQELDRQTAPPTRRL